MQFKVGMNVLTLREGYGCSPSVTGYLYADDETEGAEKIVNAAIALVAIATTPTTMATTAIDSTTIV
ncbi:hypothetical protein I4U23_017422 [Adineta vaga]|nr:hypothetical protein I4U23_017422 [Adineta vaga]